jgi:hypothetical protein
MDVLRTTVPKRVVFETRRARAATPEVLGLSKKEDMDETLKRTRSDAEG